MTDDPLSEFDCELLQELASHMGWVTAETVALNLPYSQTEIEAKCEDFIESDALEAHPEATAYRLTESGGTLLLMSMGCEESDAIELEYSSEDNG